MRIFRYPLRAFLVIATIPFVVTGCGRQAGNAQNQAQANGSGAEARFRDPETAYAGAVDRRNWRIANTAWCVENARNRATRREGRNPAGTDFQPYCACLIDRLMASRTTVELDGFHFGEREQDMAAQCARQHGLRPDAGIMEAGSPFPDRQATVPIPTHSPMKNGGSQRATVPDG